MRANAAMPRSLLHEPSQTGHKNGLGRIGEQVVMELRPFDQHREIIYAALRDAVDSGWTKQESFADDVGMSNRDTSLRLNHANCSKGYPQLAPVEFIAWIATKPIARERFLRAVADDWGFKVEPKALPTPDETVRALASEMTERQRRRLEREKGWPDGWLDR